MERIAAGPLVVTIDKGEAGDQRPSREPTRAPDQFAELGDALWRDARDGAGRQRRLGSRESFVADVDLDPRSTPGAPQIQRKDVQAVELAVAGHPVAQQGGGSVAESQTRQRLADDLPGPVRAVHGRIEIDLELGGPASAQLRSQPEPE